MTPKVMTLVQFAVERGLTTTADVQAHIHAGLRSMPTSKTYARWNKQKLEQLQDERDATAVAYRAAIAAGEIQEPKQTGLDALREKAAGHPDNPSVQAAKRLLAKMEARLAADESRLALAEGGAS